MTTVELIGTVLFGVAVIHTFLAGRLKVWGNKFPEGSVRENFLHLMGETEVVFGVWAGVLFFSIAAASGWHEAVEYIEGRDYTEPMFVVVIMAIAWTNPVMVFAKGLIGLVGRGIGGLARGLLLPVNRHMAFYLACLIVGPLLGSLITEPAAMTIIALLLRDSFYKKNPSRIFRYSTLGVLFVSVSIGGTLTPYAAPPVLMVAQKWGWDFSFMVTNFGWKAIVAILISSIGVAVFNRSTFRALQEQDDKTLALNGQAVKQSMRPEMKAPWWIIAAHLGFLSFVVLTSHHWPVFMGAFVFFLGVMKVTDEFQTPHKIMESMLVGFFLCGLVVLGGLQSWWLEPVIASLDSFALFGGAIGLTALTDNAALTYLGSLVKGMSDAEKYSLVAGALTGGGLTLIANAPNPAGFSILKEYFENPETGKGFSPLGLLIAALPPTLVAALCFWFL